MSRHDRTCSYAPVRSLSHSHSYTFVCCGFNNHGQKFLDICVKRIVGCENNFVNCCEYFSLPTLLIDSAPFYSHKILVWRNRIEIVEVGILNRMVDILSLSLYKCFFSLSSLNSPIFNTCASDQILSTCKRIYRQTIRKIMLEVFFFVYSICELKTRTERNRFERAHLWLNELLIYIKDACSLKINLYSPSNTLDIIQFRRRRRRKNHHVFRWECLFYINL